jgi:hypothetical protein
MMKTFLNLSSLFLLLVGISTPSQAISFRFKFKVNSSGPTMYACNAGLRHQPSQKRVCYFKGTTNACTPNTCADGTICDTQCLCAGANGGAYLMDYFKLSAAEWTDNGEPTSPVNMNPIRTLGSSAFSQQFDDKTAWNKIISQLQFNLGSELYGAEYFVDICYRGPQIEYFKDNVAANFSLMAETGITDFLAQAPNPGDNSRDGLVIPGTVDGKKYSQLAGLNVQAFTVCDNQGEGSLQYAVNGSNQYNTADNEANFTLGSSQFPVSGTDRFFSSSNQSFATNEMTLINTWATSNSSRTPRFCKVRYIFSETNQFSTLPNFRKWQRHGAEVCTTTSIEESLP